MPLLFRQESQEVLPQTSIMSTPRQYLRLIAKMSGPMADRARFLLRRGRAFRTGRHTYSGPRGTPKLCFMNAGNLAIANPEMTYVEGYVRLLGSIPIEHAWCMDPDGVVVDPTLKTGEDIDHYFGAAFTTDFLVHTIRRSGVWGLLGCRTRISIEELDGEVLDREPTLC
jgi:hypothetical protein